ncbi:MAG: hypothetical protein KDD42_01730, partial [Bdellovibrionales bacterium]|nr:hypothetical protein [Bdellovibrionales bacterium]
MEREDSCLFFEMGRPKDFWQVYQAFRLVHDQYCRAGLLSPRPNQLRFFLRDLLSDATAIVATFDNQVIGTATGIKLGSSELPCSKIYRKEILDLLSRGRIVGEGTKFACLKCPQTTPRGVGGMSLVSKEILRWLFGW